MRNPFRLGFWLLAAGLVLAGTACGRSEEIPTYDVQATITSLTQANSITSVDSAQTPEILPGQINVREVSGFSDDYHYWYIYGLVSNDTDRAVNNIEIEIQLLDSDGGVLYTGTTYTGNTSLAAGETSPFTFYTYDELRGVESIAAKIVTNGYTELNRASLDFFGITLWYDDIFNDVYLSGNVTNNNANPVEISGLAASLNDPAGAIVSANTAYPFLYHLEPGDSSPFTIMFDAPSGEGATLTNYSLYLDAEFAAPITGYELVTSQEHFGYLDAYGDFHLIGTITNNSSANLNVRLLAGIYDDAGNCIDSSSFFLPVAIAPGVTIPYDFDLWGALDSTRDAYRTATQFEIYIDWYSIYEAHVVPVHISTTEDINTFDGYSATFTGNVFNDAGRDLNSATVIISLYNRTTGELIATDYSYVSGPIANNGTVPYTANLYPESEFDPTNVEFNITAFGQ
jgi:hypothetical protein